MSAESWSWFFYMSSCSKLSRWSGHDNLLSPRHRKILETRGDWILELKFKKISPTPTQLVSSYFQVYLVAQLFWTSGQFLNFKFGSPWCWQSFGKGSKCLGFHGSSAGKESACNAGDPGSIPGLGRYPGEGSSYLLKYSDLENSTDCIDNG